MTYRKFLLEQIKLLLDEKKTKPSVQRRLMIDYELSKIYIELGRIVFEKDEV